MDQLWDMDSLRFPTIPNWFAIDSLCLITIIANPLICKDYSWHVMPSSSPLLTTTLSEYRLAVPMKFCGNPLRNWMIETTLKTHTVLLTNRATLHDLYKLRPNIFEIRYTPWATCENLLFVCVNCKVNDLRGNSHDTGNPGYYHPAL